MAIERRYSDIYHDLQDKDYYTVPAERLPKIHYSKLAVPARHNLYIMRQFPDAEVQDAFRADMTPNQRYYADNGYLILRNFIPSELIDRYLALREANGFGQNQFPDATPFIEHKELRDILIYKPLMDVVRELHAAQMGLIFALTGFKSTKRGWHQDAYLDADEAVPRLASWIACGDVTDQTGPFEFVPESHRWMALSNEKINQFLRPEVQWPQGHVARKAGELGWGRISEAFIDPAVYEKIDRDGAEIKEFTAKKGDVLLWYGRLMHRGSPPRQPGATRPGLIGHYAPVFELRRGYFAKDQSGEQFICPPHKIHHIHSERSEA